MTTTPETLPDPADLLTAPEVAGMLHLKPDSVQIAARRGKLPCYQIGRRRLFIKADIQAFIETRRRNGGTLNDKTFDGLTSRKKKGGAA